jgi:hypothetical protein
MKMTKKNPPKNRGKLQKSLKKKKKPKKGNKSLKW